MKQDLQAAWWSKWMEMGLWFFHITIPISAGGLPIKTIQESNINTLVQAIFRLNNTCPRRVRRKKKADVLQRSFHHYSLLCALLHHPHISIHRSLLPALGSAVKIPFVPLFPQLTAKCYFPFPPFTAILLILLLSFFFSFLLLILQYVLAIKHQYTGFKLKLLSHIRYIHECVCIYIYIYI